MDWVYISLELKAPCTFSQTKYPGYLPCVAVRISLAILIASKKRDDLEHSKPSLLPAIDMS